MAGRGDGSILTSKSLEEIRQRFANGEGATALGRAYGCTRQNIYRIVKSDPDHIGKPRKPYKKNNVFLKSPYANLRKWILDESNPVTYTDMVHAVMGGNNRETTRQMKQIVVGAEHCYVTIHQIRKMLKLTGMTFEELFYREPQKKEESKPGDNV